GPTLAAGVLSSIYALLPGGGFALGLVLLPAGGLLKPAAELRALAPADVKIVVGLLAPLLFELAFLLFPIAFDTIPIHRFAPLFASFLFASFLSLECPAGEPSAPTKVPMRDAGRLRAVPKNVRKRQGRSRPLCRLRPS